MTSEVLILNKRAIVLGADSAVTTSGGEHPRYSKSATKIFELSRNGSVAAAIYGSAAIDSVPWELALKIFRGQLAGASFDRVNEYSAALIGFLSGNNKLFPQTLRDKWVESQFDLALKEILKNAKDNSPTIFDEILSTQDRHTIWKAEALRIRNILDSKGISKTLTQAPLDRLLSNLDPWVLRAQGQIEAVSAFAGLDALDLAELGHKLRYVIPSMVLGGGSGLVIAGYGEEQIFPAYEQLVVYGHVGDELCYESIKNFEVTHDGIAMIQPLAQTSMIDMFTDGFGPSLEVIIDHQWDKSFRKMFSELAENGIDVPQDLADSIRQQCHQEFMIAWKRENWRLNFNPLIDVLQTLSIQEMAHLAESLLGLESLKERVTSASESIGGPIDVAAITKSEGLVWIKRKHYFDAALNTRYVTRLERSFD